MLKEALAKLGNKARAVATGKEEPDPAPNRAQRRQRAHQKRAAQARAARRKHEGRYPRG